jgi:hypothetical protein
MKVSTGAVQVARDAAGRDHQLIDECDDHAAGETEGGRGHRLEAIHLTRRAGAVFVAEVFDAALPDRVFSH